MIVGLLAIAVYFTNFAAGDAPLLLLVTRYAKLFLIIVAVSAVTIISGICLFSLRRGDSDGGKRGGR